ncbi:MAG: succinate dehydrogenase [Chloroflexota bacterium]
MTAWPASLRSTRPPRKPTGTAPQGLGATSRKDDWWSSPLGVGFWLAVLVLYSGFSALLWKPLFGAPYEVGPYLSPFLLPFFRDLGLPFDVSPAIVTLWIPVGFRVTCYYFRRAYYRAYLADPPACAVGEPTIHRRYRLETAFPFILQNLHRLFLYLAVVLLTIHWVEVLASFVHDGAFQLALGSAILLVDTALLTLYVGSCHSLRHLVGGKLDCFSCSRVNRTRHSAWRRLSGLNQRHMVYAWASLVSIVVADLYIHLLGLGILSDPQIRF